MTRNTTIKHIFTIFTIFAASLFGHQAVAQVTVGSDKAPARAALLEIKSEEEQNGIKPTTPTDPNNITSGTNGGGFGLPRVYLVDKTTLEPFINTADTEWDSSNKETTKIKHAGLMVYNIKENYTTETNTDLRFRKGIYIWDGTMWTMIREDAGERYFYIPSFNIKLTQITPLGDPDLICDLYKEYKRQFTKDDIDSPGTDRTTFVSNNSSLTTIPAPVYGTLYAADELDYVITHYDTNILDITDLSNDGKMSYRVKSLETTPDSYLNVVFIIKDK